MKHTFHAYTTADATILTILTDSEDLNANGEPITTYTEFESWVAELRDMGFFDADTARALDEAADIYCGAISE